MRKPSRRSAPVYSVSQINQYVSRLLESQTVLHHISIMGEVSNVKVYRTGQMYFTLKDDKAAISCTLFASDVPPGGLPFRMSDGQKVIARGKISLYERSGTYQLIVKQLALAGEGEYYLQYLRLKKELEAKGFFDVSKKKPIPRFPKKVGIVTAGNGAAIEDIRSIALRRNPYVQLYLYPSKVQGAGASLEIASGIQFFDHFGVDIIIIGRGGGSIEDLWAFNEMPVINAVYKAETPIISGTGHETDTTIADFVADLRAPTPSAACEQAIPEIRSILQNLMGYGESLYNGTRRCLESQRKELQVLQHKMEGMRPDRKLLEKRMRLQQLQQMMLESINRHLADYRQQYTVLAQKLNALSPQNRLTGGYAFVQKSNGEPVQSVNDLDADSTFTMTFRDGKATVTPAHLEKEFFTTEDET